MQKKTIVIITSGQPSANPRAVKEAIALSEAGYDVTVIYAPLSAWADAFDEELFSTKPLIKWKRAGYHPLQYPKKYKLIRLRRKIHELLFKTTPSGVSTPQNAYVLYAQELSKEAKQIKADIYIAHNLGALPAAVNAAKKWNATAAFDAEDYHRGEAAGDSLHYRLAKKIEDKYIPRIKYLTAASPLIGQAYKQHYPNIKIEVINNVFSIQYLARGEKVKTNELTLFWFSQTIGKERGLEDVCNALDLSGNKNIKLYLLGICSDEMKNYLRNMWVHHPAHNENLYFLPPCHPDRIFEITAEFDLGLALEEHISLNREYCLTNKIFTYLLSGNTIIASDTEAQKQFLEENKNIGFVYEAGNVRQLSALLNHLYNARETINHNRNHILELARSKFNFEVESVKLKKLVAEALN